MRRLLLVGFLTFSLGCPAAQATWVLTFQDEFDGPANSAPAAHWKLKNERWKANQELQVYTNRLENVFLDGQGHLILRAKEEVYTLGGETGNYTSGRISTALYHGDIPTFSQQYGKWEARLKAPVGNGLVSSWWTVGTTGFWPGNGEVDIVELVGRYLDKMFLGLHAAKSDGSHYAVLKTVTRANMVNAWHIHTLLWEPGKLTWLTDGAVSGWTLTKEVVGVPPRVWPFDDQPHRPILCLSVGGTFGGAPDGSTVFPADLLVDYVRVYADSAVPAPTPTPTPAPDAREMARQKLIGLGMTANEADVTVNP